jgi:hypothetical protein
VLVPTLVLLVCGAIVLVGAVAELLDTVRARRAPALVPSPGSDVPSGGIADVGRWPMLAWFGLAAGTVLVASATGGRRPDIDDLTLVVLLLGFAADRAYYLVRRRTSGYGRAVRAEILAVVTGAVGLLAGFTL